MALPGVAACPVRISRSPLCASCRCLRSSDRVRVEVRVAGLRRSARSMTLGADNEGGSSLGYTGTSCGVRAPKVACASRSNESASRYWYHTLKARL